MNSKLPMFLRMQIKNYHKNQTKVVFSSVLLFDTCLLFPMPKRKTEDLLNRYNQNSFF